MSVNYRLNFEAIGTKWVIDFQKKSVNTSILLKKIQQEIDNFSNVFSRFKEDSQISFAGKSKRKIEIHKKYLLLVGIYQKLYKLTDGLFTPLVGNLLIDAGYDADYSLNPSG